MLKIYNTLTKKKEKFIPLKVNEVSMYVCGPTVYDYFHIGNARTFTMADVLRRYLIYCGYKVKYVMNLTDVDDKIIQKSNTEGVKPEEVASKYITTFMEDIRALKIMEANYYPKATLHMDDIINMIKVLVDKGYAYNVNGNVYYDVSKFKNYGKLSSKKIEDLEAGARVEVSEEKRSPLDFALWKKAKPGEPFWESEWGNGRPGWHIECSAMSCKHLGETFDLHAGGNDLIFPHHENEIAQSEAANDKKFANYWIHFGFLNINKEKMSKSLGNFFTARDVLQKFKAEAIRLFFLQAYYRGPLEFTDELLSSSEKGLEKLDNLVHKIKTKLKKNDGTGRISKLKISEFEQRFKEAMDDDLNTSQAVAVIFDFVKEVNKEISNNEKLNHDFYVAVKAFLSKTAESVFGICSFDENTESGDDGFENELINNLIEKRTDAKKNKNYKLADEIRDRLNGMGVILEDSKDGTSFKKIH